jgi:hypothetical protein
MELIVSLYKSLELLRLLSIERRFCHVRPGLFAGVSIAERDIGQDPAREDNVIACGE